MGEHRYTVQDAANILGISDSAVRNRLSRGTLEGVKIEGVTYVVLEDIPPTQGATDHRDELIQVLREQLDAEREANRENRRIIMQQAQNIAAIEAPENVPQGTEEPQAETQGSRRSWWRRLLGLE